MAYRLARPALRGFSSRPRGSKQATDRQSGGVLNIEKKLIAVGTLPRLAPRRSSTPPPPPKKKEKRFPPPPPAMFANAERGEKRGRDVRQKDNDGERDRDENVGAARGRGRRVSTSAN